MNKKNITFVIHPTPYSDFDILAIGSFHLLEQLSHKIEHSNLIKSSKFGGIPILILDTCDTLRDAMNCIKGCRKLYGTTTSVVENYSRNCMKSLKSHAKIIYSKNNAIIEAGEVLDYKKLKIRKEDTIYLSLRKKEGCSIIYMRPDEAIGICAVLNWTIWHTYDKA